MILSLSDVVNQYIFFRLAEPIGRLWHQHKFIEISLVLQTQSSVRNVFAITWCSIISHFYCEYKHYMCIRKEFQSWKPISTLFPFFMKLAIEFFTQQGKTRRKVTWLERADYWSKILVNICGVLKLISLFPAYFK